MSRRHWSSRVTAWAVVCLLVLKAAVPFFAAQAAEVRGVSVAEVCPLYGVALPARAGAADDAPAHASVHAGHPGGLAAADDVATATGLSGHAHSGPHGADAAHGGDHCALSALATLAMADLAALAALPAPAAPSIPAAATFDAPPDPAAAWAARLHHAPPTRA